MKRRKIKMMNHIGRMIQSLHGREVDPKNQSKEVLKIAKPTVPLLPNHAVHHRKREDDPERKWIVRMRDHRLNLPNGEADPQRAKYRTPWFHKVNHLNKTNFLQK